MLQRLLAFPFAAFAGLAVLIAGCGDAEETEAAPLVHYIDRVTQDVVEAPAQPTPAIHPETGQATLVRAGWCEQCEAWHPVPPEGNPAAARCPKHDTPLSLDGPAAANGDGPQE